MSMAVQRIPAAAHDLEVVRRRRWANTGAIYLLMLIFAVLFVGPFLFAALSSLKDNPVEWPPRLVFSQIKPSNLIAAFRLGRAGGGSGWVGAFIPGAVVAFAVTYAVPKGQTARMPVAVVPRRVPGTAGAALMALAENKFASDNATVDRVREIGQKQQADGTKLVTYGFRIRHTGHIACSTLPVDITVPLYMKYVRTTLEPSRIERLGQVQSWKNLTAGLFPYIFDNYFRVFRENYSRSTGAHLFFCWIKNSFFLTFTRVLTTLLFASMAGFALARLKFAGKSAIFMLMLFSMMVPFQVTFISNYLVLRDGIFGLSKLFGVPTLLNRYAGLILSGLVGASAVFIMKQFFEGLPPSLEESARIDGASTYQIYARLFLPLARPALGALTILTFQSVWNEFFWALVVITSPQDKYPLTVGLLTLRRTYGAAAFDWGPILAGTLISALPIIILFAVFQRYFVEGISFTGNKG